MSKSVEPNPPLVLIVDDEDLVRSVLVRSLAREGYGVVPAAGRREAVDLMAQHGRPLDLAIIDMHLDGMGGESLADLLHLRQPELPVLFITGDMVTERRGEGPLLTKPFSPDTFARCVHEYLKTGCLQDRA